MKTRTLIATLISFPLLASAQESPAVIIVEEDDISFEEAAAAIMQEEAELAENTDDSESEFTQELDDSSISQDVEPLPEIPEKVIKEEFTPKTPVFIKTEIPRPIELAPSASGNVTLKSPWAPKPKQKAPSGWRYTPAPASEAYPMEVSLKNGKKLKLSVIPHKLVPDDSPLIVQAVEPGYNPDQGYQQTDSVSARLFSATETLSSASSSLDSSIEKLTLLVNSLPKK
ncbi:hypothetical protein ACFPK9_04905 [Rubritalea spongiae]|uniref:Uncharacterized protein n=1 Tax=Rubritalea spongiae TaxID=430797 RepID=A0ABW5E8M0_9BACT